MLACMHVLNLSFSRTSVIYEGAMHTVNQYYLYYINNNRLDVLFELIQESIIITQCLLQLHGYNAFIPLSCQ